MDFQLLNVQVEKKYSVERIIYIKILSITSFLLLIFLEDSQHIVEYNVDYVGNDINDGENIPKPLITSSAYDCGVECAKEPNCVGFSWSDLHRTGFEGNCWMKSAMPEDAKMAMDHVVSGFKPEVNCNFFPNFKSSTM